MTEKQFTVRHLEDANVDVIWSEKTKAIPLGYTGALVLCDLLNELVDENEQLKSELSEKDIQLDFLKAENIHMSNLVNENEQLKSCNDKLQKELIKKVEEKAELKTQNQGLQFKIIDMLDFVKDKGTVTREEIKEWWNNSQRGDNL